MQKQLGSLEDAVLAAEQEMSAAAALAKRLRLAVEYDARTRGEGVRLAPAHTPLQTAGCPDAAQATGGAHRITHHGTEEARVRSAAPELAPPALHPHQPASEGGAETLNGPEAGVRPVTPADSGQHATTPGGEDDNLNVRADKVLQCIGTFEKAFAARNYADAAVVAVNSPEGVLRTEATWVRFRRAEAGAVPPSRSGGPPNPGTDSLLGSSHATRDPPWLLYCSALLAADPPPTPSECNAAARDAIEHGRLPLLLHWIAQNKLIPSQALGATLEAQCSCPPYPGACPRSRVRV